MSNSSQPIPGQPYVIVNMTLLHSNVSPAVAISGASTNPGTEMVMFGVNSGGGQVFTFMKQDDGSYKISSVSTPGLFLSAPDFVPNAQITNNNDGYVTWNLKPSGPSGDWITIQNASAASQGINLCLEGVLTGYFPIKQTQTSGSTAQQWILIPTTL